MIEERQLVLMGFIILMSCGLAFNGWLDERREAKKLEQEKEAKKAFEKEVAEA